MLGLWHSRLMVGPVLSFAVIIALPLLLSKVLQIPGWLQQVVAIALVVVTSLFLIDTMFATYAERHNVQRSDDDKQPGPN